MIYIQRIVKKFKLKLKNLDKKNNLKQPNNNADDKSCASATMQHPPGLDESEHQPVQRRSESGRVFNPFSISVPRMEKDKIDKTAHDIKIRETNPMSKAGKYYDVFYIYHRFSCIW